MPKDKLGNLINFPGMEDEDEEAKRLAEEQEKQRRLQKIRAMLKPEKLKTSEAGQTLGEAIGFPSDKK